MRKLLVIVLVVFASCSKEDISAMDQIESTQSSYIPLLYDISKLEGLWQVERGNAAEEIRIEDSYFKQGSASYTMKAANMVTIKLTIEIRNRYQKLYTEIDIIDSDTITVYYYSNDEGTYLYRRNYVRN